ncbi:beta-N-acetylglucosaminidase domain-containing protein [candidate division WOR-3 bacterium]|nr:beta-N-acetylglucosaminidase domain-containing protein [candidate division WOR-3 bacterium]
MRSKRFGVVEGFYRRPYTFKQRLDLVDFLQTLGLNTYIYGPKADSFNRRNWQKPYPLKKLAEFQRLNERCTSRSIRFVYALSPVHKPDIKAVTRKIDTILATGVEHYSIFFDDIKVPLTSETAASQLSIVHALHDHLAARTKRATLSFCPTQYRGFRTTPYIETIAADLHPAIDIFWTGKTVVARSITVKNVERITQIMRRPVLIWDNIFANDYIPGTILRFPYRRRAPGIIGLVRGILLNPMNDYEENKPLIHTAASFIRDPATYNTGRAWRAATRSALCAKPAGRSA